MCPFLFFWTSGEGHPRGMRDLLVSIADLEKPYEGGNILFISLSPAGEEREAPEGRRAVTVQSLVPMGKLDRTQPHGPSKNGHGTSG